ncbi:MAG: FAD-dependent oxidoreductase [Pseudomonadota bacterium]
MRYVIVGNGIAGISAAEAIRELDREGQVIMVSEEDTLPYSRPMISHVLEGSQPQEKLSIRSPDFYQAMAITPVLGQRVRSLDADQRTITLADGRVIPFDRLLIASGAAPRTLDVPGMDLGNIFYMRTRDHADQQIRALKGSRKALVLGGGLVGFKAACALLKRGLCVTQLITSGYPLAMQVDETAGRMILGTLVGHGFEVMVGVNVTGFQGKNTVETALLDNGKRLDCDLVIIGKGVNPELDYLPPGRIRTRTGVLVDEALQSSEPGIYAAGDAAETLDIARQQTWVNAIWPEAAAQGRIAGFNMAGRRVTYPGSLGRNVMRVFDLDLMTLGYANPGEDTSVSVLQSGGAGYGYYRNLVFRDDRLVGAVLVNSIEQGGVLRALIENRARITIPRHHLMSPKFNFSSLLP